MPSLRQATVKTQFEKTNMPALPKTKATFSKELEVKCPTVQSWVRQDEREGNEISNLASPVGRADLAILNSGFSLRSAT